MSQGYLLVVDDNAGIRFLLFELLTQEGYLVETVENGIECLTQVQKHMPDLVILDAKMPGKSGLETVSELKKGNPDLPIIMITAYSEIPFINRVLENGSIECYLTKPFDLNQVRYHVKALVHKKLMPGQKPSPSGEKALADWQALGTSRN